MWGLLKKKCNDPDQIFTLVFRVSYELSSGKEKSTDPVQIKIPAKNKEEAREKLRRFVVQKIRIKIF